MQWILSLSSKWRWMMTQSCPVCHSVVLVCNCRRQECNLWMNQGLFLLGWRQTLKIGVVWRGRLWHAFADITFKGRGVHPAQTRHNLVAPRHHRTGHYLAKSIPFDLCSWWALFTIGRSTNTWGRRLRQKMAQLGEWRKEGGWQWERRD